MKKQSVLRLCSLGLCALTLVGCGKGNSVSPNSKPTTIEQVTDVTTEVEDSSSNTDKDSVDLTSEASPTTVVEDTDTEVLDGTEMDDMFVLPNITQDNIGYSAYITDKLFHTVNTNVIYSPLSLNMTLGMLNSGCDGDLHAELNTFLGTDDYDSIAKKINDTYYTDLTDLTVDTEDDIYSSGIRSAFNVANSAWVSDKGSINSDYQKRIKTIYNADITNVDFTNANESVSKINRWVDERTNHLIPELLNATAIQPSTRLILVNTVYFNSPWANEWHDGKGTFTTFDGVTTDIDNIYSEEGIRYYETDKVQAFSSPYINGLQFIGILPKENGAFEISDLDISTILENDCTDNYSTIKVQMPNMKYETENDILAMALADLGFDSMFYKSSDIHVLDNEAVCVDDIIQKCTIDLDKDGTEASAATSLMVKTMSLPMPNDKNILELDFNRPYAYFIYEPETQQIAFMGKVVTVE